MILEGTFNNKDNSKTYWVKINNAGVTRYIQDNTDISQGNDIVCFGEDPVTISSDTSDTFENVYIRSCTISLVCNYNIFYDMTALNYTDIPVEIRETDENGLVIFKGYVEPLSFNQGYAYNWNEVELNCVDLLGILEYINFPTIYDNDTYLDYKSPKDIITDILNYVGFRSNIILDIVNDQTENTLINPNIFIGKSQDDWKNCKEVLETIGKTYGCWFYQNGVVCKVSNLLRPNLSTYTTFTKDMFVDIDANLSNSEAYNQISLTCNIETPNQTLVDPFDEDQMRAVFPSMYEYMNEIAAPGEGNTALNAFKNLVRRGSALDYEPATKFKHFAQVYNNPLWDFGSTNYLTNSNSILDSLDYVNEHSGSAGFFGFGVSENINNPKNTEGIHNIDLTKYFVINVDGHQRSDGTTMETQIESNNPLVTVTYPFAQNFIPNDRQTTNYIVISGKILLQPIVPKTGRNPRYNPSGIIDNFYWSGQYDKHYDKSLNTVYGCKEGWGEQRSNNNNYPDATMWHRTCPHPDNGDGAYYQQIFTSSENAQTLTGPIENEKLKKYKYQYSEHGTRIDGIDKVCVLACKLKIGNKYCVERLDLANGMNVFQWLTEDELPVVDGNTLDFFTIGINPKLDDYIVGTSFDIMDNRTIDMNIGIKGTCIPIKYEDYLQGQMEFQILGPYNISWVETNKKVKHSWIFWKKTSYESTEVNILEQIKAIYISNFKISLESDNGGIQNNNSDNDLVYYSKANAQYIEPYDYDTDLCTSLTSQEAADMGIDFKLTNNAIMTSENDNYIPFEGFDYIDKDGTTHTDTKLEEARVYEQYQLWGTTREVVEVSTKLDTPSVCVLDKNYKFSNKWKFPNTAIFRCVGREIGLKYDTMKLTLKNYEGL